MEWLWNWGGSCFGYRDGDDLWTYKGRHVGRFHGDEVYGADGRYLGKLMNEKRLIVNRGKRAWQSTFSPNANRTGYVRHTSYVG